jgi:hypothetical protein
MPVTAKLSRRFYEAFGDDIANELVEWFNQVDATYRADLRELNELNFARFDAKLEQRFAESDAKREQRFAESDAKWEQRFAESDAKWEQRFAASDVRFVEFKAEVREQISALRGELRGGLADQRADLIKWMFVFWAATIVPLGGLIVALAG